MNLPIYFDNAATTFPKPKSVLLSTQNCIKSFCANPGRSSHKLSLMASDEVYLCRETIAKAFGGEAENVVFTSNATHSINLALKSILKNGDHVLISDIEHNATLRPIEALAKKGVITYDLYRADLPPALLVAELSKKVKSNTALICACHHSNICNLTLPIAHIGFFCNQRNIVFLVDASQSAGAAFIDIARQGIDVLCAPAHKGLYGIPGCAFVLFSEKLAKSGNLDTFIEGGNGVSSLSPLMPSLLPERLEAGTLPLPSICALTSGIKFITEIGAENVQRHESSLYNLIESELIKLRQIRILSKSSGAILLFAVDGIPSEDFAAELDKYGFCTRAGFHCAPLAHKKLGTPPDGAVRLSFGIYNTKNEAISFIRTCKSLL